MSEQKKEKKGKMNQLIKMNDEKNLKITKWIEEIKGMIKKQI